MTTDRPNLHDCFASVGRPLTRGDAVLWTPTGAVYRVTSVGGLCTVRPPDATESDPNLSLRLVTRRLLGFPADVPVDDQMLVARWRTLTSADADAAMAWLRSRQPQPTQAPLPPLALAAAVSLGERCRVAGLLPHTLVRLRPSDPGLEPWLREAGHAAWEALVGEMADRVYEIPEPVRLHPGRSCRIIERWGFRRLFRAHLRLPNRGRPWPPHAPRLGLADAVRLNAVYRRAVRPWEGRFCVWRVLANHMMVVMTYANRVTIRDDLGVHGPDDVALPDPASITTERTANLVRWHAPGLPTAEAARVEDGWTLHVDGIGSNPHFRASPQDIVHRLALHWRGAWTESPAWAPAVSIQASVLDESQWSCLMRDLGDRYEETLTTLQDAIGAGWAS